MPAGNRIRGNNSFGVTTDAPLTAGATTFNSAGLATLPVVSAAHAVIVLDPKRVNGEPEIVVVTSHTALATVATIARGQYGTVARSHPAGTPWAHVPVDEDYIEILTSITRPSNPYEGQFIFETDTNKLMGYGGTDWAPRDAGGQLGYAEVTADQTGITTLTDLTGLSVTVTVGTGRRIQITGQALVKRTVADGITAGFIREGAVTLNRWFQQQPPNTADIHTSGSRIETPSAGVHTYKLSLERSTGTGTVGIAAGSGFAAFILVEDIGAA